MQSLRLLEMHRSTALLRISLMAASICLFILSSMSSSGVWWTLWCSSALQLLQRFLSGWHPHPHFSFVGNDSAKEQLFCPDWVQESWLEAEDWTNSLLPVLRFPLTEKVSFYDTSMVWFPLVDWEKLLEASMVVETITAGITTYAAPEVLAWLTTLPLLWWQAQSSSSPLKSILS